MLSGNTSFWPKVQFHLHTENTIINTANIHSLLICARPITYRVSSLSWSHRVHTALIPILQMRRLRLGEIQWWVKPTVEHSLDISVERWYYYIVIVAVLFLNEETLFMGLNIFKNNFIYSFFFFTYSCAGSSLLCRLFSSCSKQELFSHCGVRASLVAKQRL